MKKLTLLCVFACFAAISGFGQVAKVSDGKKQLVEIPAVYGVVSIINQPDAPIAFQEIQLFTDPDGGFPKIRYQIQNLSPKEVVSFTVAFHQKSNVRAWAPYSDSWVETTGNNNGKSVVLLPGAKYENFETQKAEIMPFGKEVSDLFNVDKNNPRIFTFWVGFIESVVFKDGSKYTSGKLHDGLTDILQSQP